MGRTVQVDQLLSGVKATDGSVLSAGKAYFYEPGTTTTRTVWLDSMKRNAASNPVELDGAGRALVFADGSYRLKIHDEDDTAVYDWDNLRFYFGDSGTVYDPYSVSSPVNTGAYTATVDPAPVEYSAGDQYFLRTSDSGSNTLSQAASLNVNGLGVKNIVTGSASEEIPRRAFSSNDFIHVVYDGSDFRWLSADESAYQAGGHTWSGSGSMTFTQSDQNATYRVRSGFAECVGRVVGTTSGSAANYIKGVSGLYTAKVGSSLGYMPMCGSCFITEAGGTPQSGYMVIDETTEEHRVYKHDNSNYVLGAIILCYHYIVRLDLT